MFFFFQFVPASDPSSISRLAVEASAVEALRRAEAGSPGAVQMRRVRRLSALDRDELRPGDLHARHRERPARSADRVDQSTALRPPDLAGGPH